MMRDRKGDARMNDANRTLVERIFQDAPFTRSLGIELTSCGNGWCETRLIISPWLRQQHGFVHAGALMTLADHTCGGAAASTVPEDRDVITVREQSLFLVSSFRSGTELSLWKRRSWPMVIRAA